MRGADSVPKKLSKLELGVTANEIGANGTGWRTITYTLATDSAIVVFNVNALAGTPGYGCTVSNGTVSLLYRLTSTAPWYKEGVSYFLVYNVTGTPGSTVTVTAGGNVESRLTATIIQ